MVVGCQYATPSPKESDCELTVALLQNVSGSQQPAPPTRNPVSPPVPAPPPSKEALRPTSNVFCPTSSVSRGSKQVSKPPLVHHPRTTAKLIECGIIILETMYDHLAHRYDGFETRVHGPARAGRPPRQCSGCISAVTPRIITKPACPGYTNTSTSHSACFARDPRRSRNTRSWRLCGSMVSSPLSRMVHHSSCFVLIQYDVYESPESLYDPFVSPDGDASRASTSASWAGGRPAMTRLSGIAAPHLLLS